MIHEKFSDMAEEGFIFTTKGNQFFIFWIWHYRCIACISSKKNTKDITSRHEKPLIHINSVTDEFANKSI